MANPRNTVSMEEIAAHRTTFIGHSSLAYEPTVAFGTSHKNKAVLMVGANQVKLADGAATNVIGAVDHVEPDGMVVVHDGGYIRFAGTGGTLGLGIVGAAAGATAATTVGLGFGEVVEVGADYIVVKKV